VCSLKFTIEGRIQIGKDSAIVRFLRFTLSPDLSRKAGLNASLERTNRQINKSQEKNTFKHAI
jgi:hypothetical protein